MSEDQALITISHVKEEIPNVVRHWLYLPGPDEERNTRTPFRVGVLGASEDISLNAWDKIWDVQAEPKATPSKEKKVSGSRSTKPRSKPKSKPKSNKKK